MLDMGLKVKIMGRVSSFQAVFKQIKPIGEIRRLDIVMASSKSAFPEGT
jgi:hypothetical protein